MCCAPFAALPSSSGQLTCIWIRTDATQDLGLQDYARLDGWVLMPLSEEGMNLQTEEDAAADAELAEMAEKAVENRTLQVRFADRALILLAVHS